MPFQMKIQPLEPSDAMDGDRDGEKLVVAPAPTAKSRFKRLFERQFSTMLRISSTERLPPAAGAGGGGETIVGGGGGGAGSDTEPSSVCLAKLVQSFMEDGGGGERLPVAATAKCGRNRCNCFNGNCSESSDDELDHSDSPFGAELLKNLVLCTSVVERNLLADAAKIVDKNKIGKRRDNFRRIVTEGLVAAGYDASVCKSRWEKSPNFPAGEHEYIDVVIEDGGQRLLVDVDFKSEFKIARSTKSYRVVLQSLPAIFVGPPERLQQIVGLVAEAAKRSLKKKGLHVPPWRRPDYMKSKWLAPHSRLPPSGFIATRNFSGEFELRFADANPAPAPAPVPTPAAPEAESAAAAAAGKEKITVVVSAWEPPAVKPKAASRVSGGNVVTGLASILKEKP